MLRFTAVFTFLAITLTCLSAADEKGVKELEGTYKLISAEHDGKFAEKEIIDVMTVSIKGDEFTLMKGTDDKKVAKIKVKADAKPATIDLVPQDGAEKGKTFPGIYKVEKGELTIAFSEKGDRPKEFKSGESLTVLRLKKNEK